jgi:predicted secreted protein
MPMTRNWKSTALAAALLAAAPLAVAPPAQAETLLKLTQEARVMVHPDTLAATLRIEADSPTASDAQARVNAQTAKAIALARKAPHVVATTGAYNVWHATQPTARWHAVQTVQLRGTDGPAMLGLVGALQGEGVAVQQLAWRLSPEASRKALSEATAKALKALRARATEAAGLLDLRFVEFREVRLDGNPPTPRAMPMLAMAANARGAAAPPPVAETEDVTVTATVGADAVLAPKNP